MKRLKTQPRNGRPIAGTVAPTIAGTAIALDFVGAEKKIDCRVDKSYPLDDPRFRHELGVLLGPQFLAGNRLQVLHNGDEIFPAMLAAIRNAEKSIPFETWIWRSSRRIFRKHTASVWPIGKRGR